MYELHHKCSYLKIEGTINMKDNSVNFFGKHFDNIASAIRLIKMLHFDYYLDSEDTSHHQVESFPIHVEKNIKYIYKLL